MFLYLLKEIFQSNKKTLKMYIRLAPYNFIPFFFAKLFKINIVVRSGPVYQNLSSYKKVNSKFLLKIFKRLLQFYYDSSSTIIVVTDIIRNSIRKDFNIQESKIKVISNPLNNDLFDKKIDNNLKKDEKINNKLKKDKVHFGFIGNIYEDQGVHHIIEAINLLKYKNNINVTIVGDGDSLVECKRLRDQYQLNEIIKFVGRVKPKEVVEYIEDFDICVAPFTKTDYKLRGSSALKIVEYLYCNKPVITINVKEYSFIKRNKFGFLYEADNIKQLSLLINDIINNGVIKINSKSYINHKFSKNIIFEKYLKIIKGKYV
jgi:glycosyltransferase involved in cell wall biosynthesis